MFLLSPGRSPQKHPWPCWEGDRHFPINTVLVLLACNSFVWVPKPAPPIVRECFAKRKSSKMTAPLAALQDQVLRFHLRMMYRINHHGMLKFFLLLKNSMEINRRAGEESSENELASSALAYCIVLCVIPEIQ